MVCWFLVFSLYSSFSLGSLEVTVIYEYVRTIHRSCYIRPSQGCYRIGVLQAVAGFCSYGGMSESAGKGILGGLIQGAD